MDFPRQGYWIGLPFPSPGDLPNSGIEPTSPALQADSLLTEPPGKPYPERIPKSISLFYLVPSSPLLTKFQLCLSSVFLPESTKSQQTIVTKSTKFWSQVVGVKILPLLFISNLLTFLCLSFFHLQNENNNSTYLIGLLKGLNV